MNLPNWTGGCTRHKVRAAIEVKHLMRALGGPHENLGAPLWRVFRGINITRPVSVLCNILAGSRKTCARNCNWFYIFNFPMCQPSSDFDCRNIFHFPPSTFLVPSSIPGHTDQPLLKGPMEFAHSPILIKMREILL